MRGSAATRRYARALFSLAREGDQVDAVRGELETMAGLLSESAELRRALLTPLHPVAERKGVLRRLTEQTGMSAEVRHFFAYLIDQRRLVGFAAIHEEYERLADEASGRMTAQVVTASPLDSARRERLCSALSQRTGRDIQLEVEVDPALIGGAIAKVGDLVFDGSLRTQLRQLRANMTK
ncbi:MAG: ATP synthase F1 subunit delta [Proteobacteria bacterium]|nr:ATP synthase F1 subunit delta [Pseudomonadota bacterium]